MASLSGAASRAGLDTAAALTSLTAARRLAADLEQAELALIEAARDGGATWSQIAAALGASNRQWLPPQAAPSAGGGRRAAPKITDAIIAEGRYEIVRAPGHAETRAWHVLVSGVLAGLVRPTWRGERSRPGWEPVDAAGTAMPASGIGRTTSAGNARTRDAAAVSLLRALQRQQQEARKKAAR